MMKINFSQVIGRHGWIFLLLSVSILERSIFPVLIFPLILQQKRNQGFLSEKVTVIDTPETKHLLLSPQTEEDPDEEAGKTVCSN